MKKYIVPIEVKKSTLMVVDADSPEQANQIITDRARQTYNYIEEVFRDVLFDSIIIKLGYEANFVPQEECNENHADYPICPKCGYER